MALQQSKPLAQLQRIRVETEPDQADKRVKIRLENYDEFLGWYTCGSLSLGLHQLPLLEQAVEAMRSYADCQEISGEKVIPFHGSLPQSGVEQRN